MWPGSAPSILTPTHRQWMVREVSHRRMHAHTCKPLMQLAPKLFEEHMGRGPRMYADSQTHASNMHTHKRGMHAHARPPAHGESASQCRGFGHISLHVEPRGPSTLQRQRQDVSPRRHASQRQTQSPFSEIFPKETYL
jgi:hypothetical protein